MMRICRGGAGEDVKEMIGDRVEVKPSKRDAKSWQISM
jgi:hypothetical protein